MGRGIRRFIAVSLFVVLAGCTSRGFREATESLGNYMEQRNVTGCVCVEVLVAGGYGGALNSRFTGFLKSGDIPEEFCMSMCGVNVPEIQPRPVAPLVPEGGPVG